MSAFSRNKSDSKVVVQAAFTLVELLLVMAVLAVVLALAVPAVTALIGARNVTKSAYDIAGALDSARAYAMVNNTYTWTGFYEEDTSAASPTSVAPPYTGRGRVVLAIVASKDGTVIVDDADTSSVTLDPTRITPVGKLIKITGAHLTDIGAPSGTASANAADSLDSRSDLPYDATAQGPDTSQNRLSSDGTGATLRPFTTQGYTFYKTVRFNPRGEASLNGSGQIRRMCEIALRPTHGGTVDSTTPDAAAIQFTGVSGSVKIYRR